MKKYEKKPGRIRRAKDKQEAVKIERYSGKAEELLERYAWSAEETVLLRLLAEGSIPFPEIKLLTWGSFDLKREVLFYDGREIYLAAETGSALERLLAEQSEESGTDRESLIRSREELFSAKTAREVQKSLAQS